MLSLKLIMTALMLTQASATSVPVVVLHGVASNAETVQDLADWIADTFNVYTINLEIGNGKQTSLDTPMNQQVDMLCSEIYEREELSSGFDFVGMSQGGLLARGYVERCNKYPVRNLITLATPHGGTYEPGVPLSTVPASIRGYWRNPRKMSQYIEKCDYLPGLNTEKKTSLDPLQRENMLTLNNFVMVWSTHDGVVNPHESGAFSFYDRSHAIIPIYHTEIYHQDTLGLKMLDKTGRLHIYQTNCTHQDHKEPHCYENQLHGIFQKYLGNSQN